MIDFFFQFSSKGKLFKENIDAKLEPVYKLKDHLKLNDYLKKNFETMINEQEMNDLYELITKMDLKKVFDEDDKDLDDSEIDKALKEWSKKLIDNFGAKSAEKIDNMKSSLNKSTIDFRNEIIQLKQDIERQEFRNDAKSYQDEQNMRKLKELFRTDIDKELKEIIFRLYQVDQTNQIQRFNKKLALNKKIYLNDLKKSDCNLIIQYLEHIQMFKRKLWSKLSSTFSELITNLNTDSDASKGFKGDTLILKSLNECIEKAIKNYDTFITKTIDHTLDNVNKKLKEFDDKYIQELQVNENRVNKELTDKIIQSFDMGKLIQTIEMSKKN